MLAGWNESIVAAPAQPTRTLALSPFINTPEHSKIRSLHVDASVKAAKFHSLVLDSLVYGIMYLQSHPFATISNRRTHRRI